MAAQGAAAMGRLHVLHMSPEAVIRLAFSFRWPVINPAILRGGHTLGALTGGLILACAAATLAVMPHQQTGQGKLVSDSVPNETIVFRNKQHTYGQTGQLEATDASDELSVPSHFPRAVQTLRFFNPSRPRNAALTDERAVKGKPDKINGPTSISTETTRYRSEGVASWYGPDFHGRRTANGERYDMNGISAAHRTMPLPSYARVTNLENGRSIIVRVNNRGPFAHKRVADLSIGAAKALDFYKKGTARVRVEFVGPAPREGSDDQMLLATLRAGTPAPAPATLAAAETALPPPSNASEGHEGPSASAEPARRPSRRANPS
jgi:rare lipoprotein A (peptidoglycan hydrolase)